MIKKLLRKIKTICLLEDIKKYVDDCNINTGALTWGFEMRWSDGRGEWITKVTQPMCVGDEISTRTFEGADVDLYEALKKLDADMMKYLG